MTDIEDSQAITLLLQLWEDIPPNIDLTLVGGGALYYWTREYSALYPKFFEDKPVFTTDIDFVSSIEAARLCYQHWEKLDPTIIEPGCHTPEKAIIFFPTQGKEAQIHIDFLEDIIGIKSHQIKSGRGRTQLSNGIYVLTELMLLTSRVANTVRLSAYQNIHAYTQIRQSIAVVKAAIQTSIDAELYQTATRLTYGLLELAAHTQLGIPLFVKFNIDLFEGFIDSDLLDENFRKHGRPKLLEKIHMARASLAARQKPQLD